MAIFGPKPWTNPFGNISIFRVFERLVFIAQKGVFLFQTIVKGIFLAYIAGNKKMEKWLIFDQKRGLTPLQKSLFFDFWKFVFMAQKGAFLYQTIVKDIFLAYIAGNKKIEKQPIFDQIHGLTPLEKSQIFDFFNLSLFQPRKALFRSQLS